MSQEIISILSYETKVNAGAYFHLKTDWFESDQEIKTIIIDQDHVYSKLLSLYPRGFAMYLEQDAEGSIYRTNYPLYQIEGSDSYYVDWNASNYHS
ncbi:hypothetical protein NHG25_06750 [Aerococcaceae bacterium NML191292]|nr:hypothetical protein [Aerococcaceae bacterium NML210727]MCW6654283.1 hypothetical protein [Aerococcaceae bacterium NML201296]MCW6660176.1 hypothetical protein [Aerococcaceae bacterium NML191292]MCW6661058.1 hypothetical protein [Aerococcaceae bacterium NML201209]MCW6664116.1 hypothetical protein [Aerococcaceae bacterium NML191219]MCW6667070.1 hypothetical protein [Aerococcaceae bacterium NML190938]MCW6674551.1 hypothetical protein [Aerococcaceae bacterium NML171108]MCW6681424.1 hypothetic